MILCISPPTHAALALPVSSLANIFTCTSCTSFFINLVTTSVPRNCLPLWLLSSSGLLFFEASVWFYSATTKTAYLRSTQAARAPLECNVVCMKSGITQTIADHLSRWHLSPTHQQRFSKLTSRLTTTHVYCPPELFAFQISC